MPGKELTLDAWAERHAIIFGLHADTDARTLLEWCALFEKAGFRPEELNEATEWLALQAPIGSLRSRADHLMMLRERVRDRRGERAKDEELRRRRREDSRQKEAADERRRRLAAGGVTKMSDIIDAVAQRQGISRGDKNEEGGPCK